MANKIIEVEGYGTIVLNPINFKDKEYESVDLNGNPLKWIAGKMAMMGHFESEDGTEVPKSHMCKKVEVDEEIILIQKFNPTGKVEMDDIEVSEDNSEIYTAIDRKIYKVFTESQKLKKLVLDDRKTLKFPVSFGSGFKIYNGILTNWKGQMILCGVRGDINEMLKKFEDDVVEIEIETIPIQNKKKLLKVMA